MEFRTTYQKLIRIMPVMFLLTVYMTALWHKGPAHYFHHSHNNESLHSDDCGNDACHVAIYHHDLSHGCDHKAHIIPLQDKCHSCDEILLQQSFEDRSADHDLIQMPQGDDHFIVKAFRSVHRLSASTRGPPHIV